MNKYWNVTDLPVTSPPVSQPSPFMFLSKWRGTIAVVVVCVVSVAAVLLYVIPQTYTAAASVLVERNRAPMMRTEFSPGLEQAEVMNTERAIASSREVISRVVNVLDLTEVPLTEGRLGAVLRYVTAQLVAVGLWPDVDPREQWIERVSQLAVIKPQVNSNVLSISIGTSSPELSSMIVNALAGEYIKLRMQIYSTKGLTDFYRQHAADTNESYQALRQELLDFKEKVGLAASTATKGEFVKELGELRAQQLSLSNDRARLLQRYTPGHQEVRLIDASLAGAAARIADLESQLRGAQRSEAIVSDLEMRLDAQRSKLLDYTSKYREARINERAGEDVVNVRMIEEAARPPRPRFSRLFWLSTSILLGFVLGIAAAFSRQYLDNRVDSPDVTERILGFPVIGEIEPLSRRARCRILVREVTQPRSSL